jgi:hypothetical protein
LNVPRIANFPILRGFPELEDAPDVPFEVDEGPEDAAVLVPLPALADAVFVARAAVLVSVLPGTIAVLVTALSLEFVSPTVFPQATNLCHPVSNS